MIYAELKGFPPDRMFNCRVKCKKIKCFFKSLASHTHLQCEIHQVIWHSFLKMTIVYSAFLDVNGVVFWFCGCAWARGAGASVCFQVGSDVWTGLCEAEEGALTHHMALLQAFSLQHNTWSVSHTVHHNVSLYYAFLWLEMRRTMSFADVKVHFCLSLKVVYLLERVTLKDPHFQRGHDWAGD